MSPNLASSWASALWTASWQGLVFIGFIWLVCVLFRRLPSSVKAWLWWLASLKLLVGLLWTGVLLPVLPPVATSPLAQLNHRLDLMAPKTFGNPGSDAPVSETLSPPGPTRPEPVAVDFGLSALLLLWAAGTLGILASVAYQGLRMSGLRRRSERAGATRSGELARELGARMGLARSPAILKSPEITAPMVAGIFKPALILPLDLESSLTEPELRLCIAHELAHIRRNDLGLAVAPSLVQAIYFFFPPAWLIRREWELEREAACDAEAITITESTPAAYGQLLMKIVTADHKGGLVSALGATANYHTLKKRIKNMMNHSQTTRSIKFVGMTIALLALVLGVPWQITARADGEPAQEEKSVVLNGGFEEGTKNWEAGSLGPESSTRVSLDQDTKHTGNASLRFDKSEATFFPVALMKQFIPWDGKTRFIRVSAWIKAENALKFTVALDQDAGDKGRQWAAYVGTDRSKEPVSHDWKQYKTTLRIPDAVRSIGLSLQMYGRGTVWIDDISATFSDSAPSENDEALADVKDVSNERISVAGDPMMEYFLVGGESIKPGTVVKLLLVVPGGDGSADFNPFIRRIWKNALPPGYLIAELVAPKWSDDQFSSIVWPTKKQRWATMKFSTEEFLDGVVKDVKRRYKLDPNGVFTLSWSSGGPAAYAASLASSSIKGSFVAMSIFSPDQLPPLFNAKGQAYYIYHSPEDKLIPMAGPQMAESELKRNGAKTFLETYEGGHGWHGDIFGSIRKGVEWLEKNAG